MESKLDPLIDSRCLSSAEVVPGVIKRCQFHTGHAGAHGFQSAIDVDGRRVSALWDDQKKVTSVEN